MESLVGHLESLNPLSVYATLAGILLLCGLGLPVPEDIPLISAGYLAHTGLLEVNRAFALCFASVLVGDTTAFFLGRWFGQRVLASRLARRFFTARKQLRVRAYFRKYGSKVVFVGRFVPGLRFSIFFSAGTLHLRAAVFFIYDSLAAVISVPMLVYAAWYFGEYIDRVVIYARRTEHGILIVVIGAAAVLLVRTLRRRKRRAQRQAQAEPKPKPSAPFPPLG